MKKVLVITYYWPPSGGGGVQRWVKFTKYMAEFNVLPIVLTVDPSQSSYALIDDTLLGDVPSNLSVVTAKTHEPFRFYKKFASKKEIPFGGFANEDNPGFLQKVSRFIRGNFFIPDARIGWNRDAYSKAVELIRQHNITTVVTSSPPHSTQLIGLKLKKEIGIQWIADMRDPWTDIYYYKKMYHSVWAKRIDKKMEFNVLKNADSVIVVSSSIKALFESKLPDQGRGKIVVIPNGYDEEDFKQQSVEKNTRFVITYTGTLAENYHIDGFLNALNRFVCENNTAISVQFVGRVCDKYRRLIEDSTLSSVVSFIGHVDHNSSIAFLQQADALFLAIPDVPHNEGILTGKLFEYLASQKPIIGIGPVKGDAALIIDECSAGKIFSYSDEEEMYSYLHDLFDDWQNSSQTVEKKDTYKKYSRKQLTRNLVEMIP